METSDQNERIVLQNVILPENEKLEAFPELFCRGCRCVRGEKGELLVPKGTRADFAAYLNGFPWNKWHLYTNVSNVHFSMEASGRFRLNLVGYAPEPVEASRTLLKSEVLTADEEKTFEFTVLDCSDDSDDKAMKQEFLAFEVEALEDCRLYGAQFWTFADPASVRTVNLVISTTTCRKEKFIRRNIETMRKAIFDNEFLPQREHIWFNIVDNGNTLRREETDSWHVKLFPNHNTGGSGGFARGMIEALHMDGSTHVLLMDDDVIILPESILRTYTLLQMVNAHYEKALLSGAMLELDRMDRMHEDIGTLLGNKDFYHVKPCRDESKLSNVLLTNEEVPRAGHDYAGWWYCCIPMSVVREKGLPLPLFIRGDDVEYGIRCNGSIMSMSGICIWHQGFLNKFSASTNFYQEFRNILIVKDTTGNIPDVDVVTRWKQEMLRALVTYHYDGAELLLLAMEDYLKGPSFIEEDHSLELLKRNGALNEKLQPLPLEKPTGVLLEKVYDGTAVMPFWKKVLYYGSYNGQRWLPKSVTHEGTGIMGFDWSHQPDKTAYKRHIMIVNPYDRTYYLRTQDRERFRTLFKRYKEDQKRYQKEHPALEKAYRAEFDTMTSETFWRKYLGI